MSQDPHAENEKLKAENKKLKQFVLGVHNNIYGTKYDDEDIVDSMDFDGIMKEWKRLDDKLVAEAEEAEDNATDPDTGDLAKYVLEELRMEYEQLEDDRDEKDEELKKLKKEIETLKKPVNHAKMMEDYTENFLQFSRKLESEMTALKKKMVEEGVPPQ